MLRRQSILSLFFVSFFVISSSWAKTVYTTVFNVVDSYKQNSLLILSGADGRIYRISKSPRNIRKLNSLIGQVVRIDYQEVSSRAFIQSISKVYSGEIDETIMDLNHFRYNELRNFAPTELKSMNDVEYIFKNLLNKGDKSISQCYKRAHIWAYDMWSKMGISSEKVFIFYTKRYTILEEFDWWFHVAPVVTFNKEKYVLDRTFMKKPVPLLDWKNYFIRTNKITCPVIDNYFDFADNQWTRLCYLVITPMYYYDPLSIENRDNGREKRNHWNLRELQFARKAFRNWSTLYPQFDTNR